MSLGQACLPELPRNSRSWKAKWCCLWKLTRRIWEGPKGGRRYQPIICPTNLPESFMLESILNKRCTHHLEEPGVCVCVCMCVCSVTQLCPTLCDPLDCSPPGPSVKRIFQARILVWDANSSSRGSSQFRDRTQVSFISWIGRWILYHRATREALSLVTQTKCGPNKMTGQRQLRNQPHYHKPWAFEPRSKAVLLGSFICYFLPPPGRPLPNKVSCFVSPCVSSDNSLLNVRQEPTLGPW